MKNVQAIKSYFEQGEHGRKVDIQELKVIPKEERDKLGKECCKVLGEKWTPAT